MGAAMAKTTTSTQPIPNSFGSDDFFNQNTNTSNANQKSKEDEFDPFGLGNNNTNGNAAESITSLYGNKQQNQQGSAQFGYQGKSMNAYGADPFAGIGGGGVSAPQPAKYVTRKKSADPFAQFGI